TVRNRTPVVVLQLLSLCGSMAEQCSSGMLKIVTDIIKRGIDKEIFLFPAKGTDNFCNILVEVLAYFRSSLIKRRKRFKQRGFKIKSFTGIRDKDCRDTKCISPDERRRCRIPRWITARFHYAAHYDMRERRSIGLLLHQL